MSIGSGMYCVSVLCVLLYISVYWVLYVLFYCLVCTVVIGSCMYCVIVLCVLLLQHAYFVYYCPIYLGDGLLARGQYPEGPATGHLGTGFAWFPCVCL